jgi:hypothetical protein
MMIQGNRMLKYKIMKSSHTNSIYEYIKEIVAL